MNFDPHTPPSAQIKLAWSQCSFAHIQLAYFFPKCMYLLSNRMQKHISVSSFFSTNQHSFMPLLHSSGESWQLCVALLWWQELQEPQWNLLTEGHTCHLRGRGALKYHHIGTTFINLQSSIKQMTAVPVNSTKEPGISNFHSNQLLQERRGIHTKF